jgi:hypothetical protein
VDLVEVIELRKLHMPRPVRWWRQRRPRCGACREAWPCGRQRYARARILQLLREVLETNRGRHW